MIREEDILHIGQIIRLHGKNGELQCRMHNTHWEDANATFIILNVEQIYVPFRVDDWRTKGTEDVLLTLNGVSTEQQAQRYIGCEAYMLRTDLPEEQQDEVEMDSLIGYTLTDEQGHLIGTITAIDTSTINTLALLDNGKLLPLHTDFIAEADVKQKKLTLRLPEGLA